jgi:hypothetical protein
MTGRDLKNKKVLSGGVTLAGSKARRIFVRNNIFEFRNIGLHQQDGE